MYAVYSALAMYILGGCCDIECCECPSLVVQVPITVLLAHSGRQRRPDVTHVTTHGVCLGCCQSDNLRNKIMGISITDDPQ